MVAEALCRAAGSRLGLCGGHSSPHQLPGNAAAPLSIPALRSAELLTGVIQLCYHRDQLFKGQFSPAFKDSIERRYIIYTWI